MRYRTMTLGLCLGLGFTTLPILAEAARPDQRNASSQRQQISQSTQTRGGFTAMPRASRQNPRQSRASQAVRRGTYGYSAGISCVPYARQATGMQISGNGRDWWHNAAGRYARSSQPEPGAILSFPSSGGMRSGHVAVVSRVINARLIEIDHANWGGPGIRRGSVMHGVDVMDVSERNDWTQVRVQVGWTNDNFGRAYPTHGFILNRPEDGSSHYASNSSGGYSRANFQRGPCNAIRTSNIRQVAHLSRPANLRSTNARPEVARAATTRPTAARAGATQAADANRR